MIEEQELAESGVLTEQATSETTPQPVDYSKEIEQKEAEIKRLQGILKAEQKRGTSVKTLEAMQTKIDRMEEYNAKVLDYLESQYGEGEAPTKQTNYQRLQEERKQKPAEQPDPDVTKFINFMHSQGLDIEHPLVKEAVSDNREPEEALEYLKGKVREQSESEIEKRVAEKLSIAVEEKLKKLGITSSGADTPNAPSGKTFTRKQIENMSIAEYSEHKDAILQAQRLGRIK